jgi:hypothetical protein
LVLVPALVEVVPAFGAVPEPPAELPAPPAGPDVVPAAPGLVASSGSGSTPTAQASGNEMMSSTRGKRLEKTEGSSTMANLG